MFPWLKTSRSRGREHFAWNLPKILTLGKMVDALQQTVNEKALIYFNQRIANTISRLYEGFDGFDSVDQAIAALFLQPSALPGILRRSYHDAFVGLEDEFNDEQEGEE